MSQQRDRRDGPTGGVDVQIFAQTPEQEGQQTSGQGTGGAAGAPAGAARASAGAADDAHPAVPEVVTQALTENAASIGRALQVLASMERSGSLQELSEILSLLRLLKSALTDDMVIGMARRVEGLAAVATDPALTDLVTRLPSALRAAQASATQAATAASEPHEPDAATARSRGISWPHVSVESGQTPGAGGARGPRKQQRVMESPATVLCRSLPPERRGSM